MSCDCENNSCNTSSSSCTTDSDGNNTCTENSCNCSSSNSSYYFCSNPCSNCTTDSNGNCTVGCQLNLPSTSTTDNISCTCKEGCMSENINECDKLICSFKTSKTYNKICTAKSIYQAIHSDISDFIYELGFILQEYSCQTDLSDECMFNCMIEWYNNIVMILYIKINNHLSISTNVNGIGKQIIGKKNPNYVSPELIVMMTESNPNGFGKIKQ